jgi:TRAP-type C4-dicarboxylate transport system permease small subunit
MWKTLRVATKGCACAGAAILFAMMLMTTADVGGRYLFGMPIAGVFEVTEFMMVCVVFLALGYTQSGKGHIEVDLFVGRLPEPLQRAVSLANSLVTFVVMALVAWMSFERAFEVMRLNETSGTLSIPVYPFLFVVSLGAAVMGLEIAADMVRLRSRGDES